MRSALLASLLFLCAAPAAALDITVELRDLDDGLGSGGSYWEATYRLVGHAFALDQGFTVYLADGDFSNLVDPELDVRLPDWDVFLAQPDAVLMAAGFYDAIAMIVAPDASQAFRVRFVWLGDGEPGPQRWALSKYESGGALRSVVESGQAATVPEPGVLALLVPLALASRRRARR